MTAIYLASASPRRRELLALLDVPFAVIAARWKSGAGPAKAR